MDQGPKETEFREQRVANMRKLQELGSFTQRLYRVRGHP